MKALEIFDLTKKYAGGVLALKGINLEVEEGSFFGLLGPNGAGKSTTIGIVSSLVNKTSGNVKILGIYLDREPARARAQLGLVPQEFNFNLFEKVIDILIQQAGYYGIEYKQARKKALYYLDKLGLTHKANQPARTLSGGLKRRLMIARGMVHDPRILILDEPTAGVDIELRRATWQFLKEINEKGTTIILTTHYLEEAESLCEKVAIINNGEIIENMSTKALLKKLDKQTFILDLRSPTTTLPTISGFELKLIDEFTIEASFHRDVTINALFEGLSNNQYVVTSMRNKSNRLESLFLDLVKSEKSV